MNIALKFLNMRTIKNLSLVLMTAAIAVFMTACGGGASSPEATAESFLNALQNADFEGAKKYATTSSAEMLDMMASMSAMGGDDAEKPEPKDITITDTQTEGDNATVMYTIEGEEEEQSLDLKKEEGEWKVVFDKSSMDMPMNMDEEEDMDDHDMDEHEHMMEGDTTMMEGDGDESM